MQEAIPIVYDHDEIRDPKLYVSAIAELVTEALKGKVLIDQFVVLKPSSTYGVELGRILIVDDQVDQAPISFQK